MIFQPEHRVPGLEPWGPAPDSGVPAPALPRPAQQTFTNTHSKYMMLLCAMSP